MKDKPTFSVVEALRIGMEMHQGGRLEEARRVYTDILEAVPNQPDALHFMGILAFQMGKHDDALALIEKSLEHAPDHPGAINNLGNIHKEIGNRDEAERAYRRVIELAPDQPDAWCNLGVVQRELNKKDEALSSLQKAVELSPNHADAHHNLGNVLADLDRREEALAAYRRSYELKPERGDSAVALAKLLNGTGDTQRAVEVLDEWLVKNPDDPIAAHMRAAYSGEDVPDRAGDGYVRQAFDDFADSFDQVLTWLNYSGPKYVDKWVRKNLVGTNRKYRILDLGCGTGLIGPILRPIAAVLDGLDLSPKMLARAKARGVYDRLVEDELTRFLHRTANKYDVIICADTFVYFGDLAPPVHGVRRVLDAGGWFVFTVESRDDAAGAEGYGLQSHGRYSHSLTYITDILNAAGLELESRRDVIIREEHGQKVSGMVCVARGK